MGSWGESRASLRWGGQRVKTARVSDTTRDGDGHRAGQPVDPALSRKALLGGIALGVRTVIVQFVVLGGTVVLARELTPADFGAFAIVQFALTFLTFFGDAGLGGALIQKKEPPTQRDLASVFYVQVAIGLTLLLLSGLGADVTRWVWKDLPEAAPWILRALALNFLLTSLRVVPTILMERELQFVRLAIHDTINSIVFYVVASILAIRGFGIWSLALGVVAQGVIGLALALILRPWVPSLVFDREALRPLLKFGVPYQLKFVVGFMHSAIAPLVAGVVLGAQSLGYINWAQSTGHFPIRLVDIVSRVSFPLYSRLQGDPAALSRAIERAIQICALGTMLFASIILPLGPYAVRVIYSEKWLPAVPLLYLFASTITIGIFFPALATALDAMGKPTVILRMSVVVTVANWIAAPLLAKLWGELGFVIANISITVLGNIALLIVFAKIQPGVRVFRALRAPLVGALFGGVAGWFLREYVRGPVSLTLVILAIAVVYLGGTLLVERHLIDQLKAAFNKQPPPPEPTL